MTDSQTFNQKLARAREALDEAESGRASYMNHVHTVWRSPSEPPPHTPLMDLYGITEWIPEDATIQLSRDGILVEVFARGNDGDFIDVEDEYGAVTDIARTKKFYPHPEETN